MNEAINTGPLPESSLINTTEDAEVKYWATRFAVSTSELIQAVKAVGNEASTVKDYLEQKQAGGSK